MNFNTYTVQKIVDESSTIKSFYLIRKNGEELSSYRPGQFITLRVKPEGAEKMVLRNYTLSDRPGTGYFRITVKKEPGGNVSSYLHSKIKENDTIEIGGPSGDFYLNESVNRPVVFLSGGVGITPMLSMLEHLAFGKSDRKVYFLHSSLNSSVQPMAKRLSEIRETCNFNINIHHSHPPADEGNGKDYDNQGIITLDFIKSYISAPQEAIYYLCGPPGFMQAMFDNLIELGVENSDIHYEFFGNAKKLGSSKNEIGAEERGYLVQFTKSNKQVTWSGAQNSLLELAEAVDIFPNNSCRMGTCSSCETKMISGKIQYDPEPFIEPRENHVFICCSQPSSDLVLEL